MTLHIPTLAKLFIACLFTATCYAHNDQKAHCGFKEQGGTITRHVDAEVQENGQRLSVSIHQAIEHSDSTARVFTNYIQNGTFMLGKDLLYSHQFAAGPDGISHVTVNWGPCEVQGATHGTFTDKNHTISGSIDGHTFVPFPDNADPSKVTFTDGFHSPVLHSKDNLAGAFKRLQDKVSDSLASCTPPSSNNDSSLLMFRRLDRVQDPGHFSDTYGATRCRNCKLGVDAAAVAAGIGCGVICAATFGIGCGACIAGASAAVVAGMTACEASGLCCPIACGGGFPGTCCFGDEKCSNGNGLCCSSSQQTCLGIACCAQDQSCITQGTEKGTCCPDSAICANKCCPGDSDVCLNGNTCCAPSDVCGTTCCSNGPGLLGVFCANKQKNLCCFGNQIDANGICCNQGQVNCNGECCSGSCSGLGGACQTSSATCKSLGGNGDTCSDAEPCVGLTFCSSGCCFNSPK